MFGVFTKLMRMVRKVAAVFMSNVKQTAVVQHIQGEADHGA